jgi:hypothetical protein
VNKNRIKFEIIEQNICYKNTVKLLGGAIIEVTVVSGDNAIVSTTMRIKIGFLPQIISSIFIDDVIKAIHQFVMQDIQA